MNTFDPMRRAIYPIRKIYLISLLAFNIQVCAQTWTPPIGIPDPSFGINETHLLYTNIVNQNQSLTYTMGVDGPYTHYVDYTANNCVDGANDGTALLPRCHIPGSENSPLPAGSVVEVHGQYDYSHTSPTDWHGAGTQQQPIFIRGASNSNMAIITGPFEVIGSSYVIVENIEFADRDGDLSNGDCGSFNITNKNGLAYSSDHIVLRHSDIHGNLIYGGIGIGESGNTASVFSDIVLYKNTIHHNGDVNATFDQDVHGVAIGTSSQNVWVLDNEMHHNSGDGIQINSGPARNTHHIYVGRNISWQNKQSGFWCKQAIDVIFSQNIAHGHRPSDSSTGAGMGYQYAPERIWFINNEIYDNTVGIIAGDDTGDGYDGQYAYVVGNLIYNIHSAGSFDPGSFWSDGMAIKIYASEYRYIINNTIYSVDAGIGCKYGITCHLVNNIISQMDSLGASHIFVENAGTNSVMHHNVLYQNGSPPIINWTGNTYNTLTSFQSATGKGQACLTTDPMFTGSGAYNLHINTLSPAIDAGADTGIVAQVYNNFFNYYGISIKKDFDNIPRPLDGNNSSTSEWDIGAYEYASCSSFIVNLGQDPSFCFGNNVLLDAGIHQSYLWSTGSTGQLITINTNGEVWVSITDSLNGYQCLSKDTINITVNPLPDVTFSVMPSVCFSDNVFALNGGSPAGGTYSGTGVSGNNFNPAVAGIGVQTITYSYTNGNGCMDSINQTINVNTCSGINDENEINNLIITPNPTEGIFTIRSSVKESMNITISNYLGQIIYNETNYRGNNKHIDLSDKETGIYFIKFENGKSVNVFRITKL